MRPVVPLIAMFAIATLATGLVNAALPQVLTNVNGDLAYGIGIGVIGVGLLFGAGVSGRSCPPTRSAAAPSSSP